MASNRSPRPDLANKVIIVEDGPLKGEEATVEYIFPLDKSRALYCLELKRGGTVQILDSGRDPRNIQYVSPYSVPVSSS